MKRMNETELKVVLLVTRKTLGWFDPVTEARKTQDYISQAQFIEFTGQSNRAIATAIQVCVEHGWIIARDRDGKLCDTSEKRRRRKIWYQLGTIFTEKISSEESSQDENLVNKTTSSSEQNDTNLVKKVHNTKVTLTKETIQSTVSNEQVVAGSIAEVIKLFEAINPQAKRFYGNTTQRKAIERMLAEHGYDVVLRATKAAVACFGKGYAPRITTPLKLELKWADLVGYYASEKDKQGQAEGSIPKVLHIPQKVKTIKQ